MKHFSTDKLKKERKKKKRKKDKAWLYQTLIQKTKTSNPTQTRTSTEGHNWGFIIQKWINTCSRMKEKEKGYFDEQVTPWAYYISISWIVYEVQLKKHQLNGGEKSSNGLSMTIMNIILRVYMTTKNSRHFNKYRYQRLHNKSHPR